MLRADPEGEEENAFDSTLNHSSHFEMGGPKELMVVSRDILPLL